MGATTENVYEQAVTQSYLGLRWRFLKAQVIKGVIVETVVKKNDTVKKELMLKEMPSVSW